MEWLHGQARWATRGRISRAPSDADSLTTVLAELGHAVAVAAPAALSLWGQTGERPDDWVCAADAVHLEAMLDHVRLHALPADALSGDDRHALLNMLRQQSDDPARMYLQVGDAVYLHGGRPFPTAKLCSLALDAREPDEFLPTGTDARLHDRLIGELQLLLHEAGINRQREERGLMPVNSVWFWGGGFATRHAALALPPLVADDPLFRGFWYSAAGEVHDWPADPARLRTSLPATFVAVMPEASARTPEAAAALAVLRDRLLLGSIRQLTLVFRDGWLMQLRRWHLFAFWRRRASMPLSAVRP
jgi:hypothetical protein